MLVAALAIAQSSVVGGQFQTRSSPQTITQTAVAQNTTVASRLFSGAGNLTSATDFETRPLAPDEPSPRA